MFDSKVVFAHAVLCGASSIILFHNHPSGNLFPSQPDKDLTHKLATAARLLDMYVLDHLIIGHDGKEGSYYSLADHGQMR